MMTHNMQKAPRISDKTAFFRVKEELIRLIGENSVNGESCIDLLMIAKYSERVSDHATNIAEWVEDSITGVHISGARESQMPYE